MSEFRKVHWTGGYPETVSGPGSTIKATEDVRKFLREVIREYNIESIFDAPCGDRNWIKTIDFQEEFSCEYFGGDIVPELVKDINMPEVSVFDIRKDNPPKVDLWFCRDCLFHLSEADIKKALQNMVFTNNSIKYLLVTSHADSSLNSPINKDIKTGGFRVLCFSEFNNFGLGEPIKVFKDGSSDSSIEKLMLLFDLSNIKRN
jgi:hypothetical protein